MSLDDLAPEAEVQVLPRYLAGPGSDDFQRAWPFPFEKGWSLHRPDDGHRIASSPCLRVQTGFLPDPKSPSSGTWTTTVQQPFGPAHWKATFTGAVPLELLHDVHTELLTLYRADQGRVEDYLPYEDVPAVEGYLPLLTHGWSHTVRKDGKQVFCSPDNAAALWHFYTGGIQGSWLFQAAITDRSPVWKATFTAGTPVPLISAFASFLVEDQPLARAVRDLPVPSTIALHASPTRSIRRPLAVAVAAAVAGTLATGTPAVAADRFGPGYSIPDADGNPGASHIGAYGPPGTLVASARQTY
ncbi:DUF317 domain-containing protein [Streptomyces sp. NPDC020875]|uniref:DUF317 domain-containing protein n=1 Tax=Streptomyces sp. NPDC020875 TaxID=3154898 RepID=UPI00340F8A32